MRILFLILFVLSSVVSFSQDSGFTARSQRSVFNIDLVYNKFTGEKLGGEKVRALIERYPKIIFEKEYDKYGEVEKYLLDPTDIREGAAQRRNEELQTKPGEKFPEFVFKTIDGETIDSKTIDKKWVLIRFEIFARRLNTSKISDLEKQIENLDPEQSLVAILCFYDNKQNIISKIDSDSTYFKLVENTRNFQEKFNLVSFPVSILLDPTRRVVGYYEQNDEMILSKLLK